MAWVPICADKWAVPSVDLPKLKSSASPVSTRVLVAGFILRAVFIASMIVVILRVSMPQNETLWTFYDTPGDLIRLLLGLAVSAWIAYQLVTVRRDADAYRTWLYLGLSAVPFALICVIGLW